MSNKATPRQGQKWATNFGKEVIKLTRVGTRNVYFQTDTGSGFMLRSRLVQEWGLVPRNFKANP
ncbi:MAG: hypothetical protein IPK22_11080 [Verrucomicrobiaceae bacterium]|nr:hypothetical protein [Verrucomicrobiaceae bacterium]